MCTQGPSIARSEKGARSNAAALPQRGDAHRVWKHAHALNTQTVESRLGLFLPLDSSRRVGDGQSGRGRARRCLISEYTNGQPGDQQPPQSAIVRSHNGGKRHPARANSDEPDVGKIHQMYK